MLIEVVFPVRPGGSSAYEKVERRAGDWAVVSAGAAVWLDRTASGSVIADARVGLAAVGPNTAGLPEISALLTGRTPSEELYAQAGAIAAASCDPVTDRRGSAEYKRHLAKELTVRALRRSVARIEAGARTNGQGG
jgi:carbon-monoxide dehydrogenase medium subunit